MRHSFISKAVCLEKKKKGTDLLTKRQKAPNNLIQPTGNQAGAFFIQPVARRLIKVVMLTNDGLTHVYDSDILCL